MGVGVGQGTEAVVIFLSSRIPQGQLDVLAINLDIGDIVLEDSGDVDLSVCVSKFDSGQRWLQAISGLVQVASLAAV